MKNFMKIAKNPFLVVKKCARFYFKSYEQLYKEIGDNIKYVHFHPF